LSSSQFDNRKDVKTAKKRYESLLNTAIQSLHSIQGTWATAIQKISLMDYIEELSYEMLGDEDSMVQFFEFCFVNA